jgi:hypothetical protein
MTRTPFFVCSSVSSRRVNLLKRETVSVLSLQARSTGSPLVYWRINVFIFRRVRQRLRWAAAGPIDPTRQAASLCCRSPPRRRPVASD